MAEPQISVCIPSYNHSRFLPQTIASVLEQTFDDFEVLIIDDCSTDGTEAILKRYALRNPRIRFGVNRENLGMVNNWNLCLEEARGKYVKYLFGDDLLLSKDALRRMLSIFETDKSISLVTSSRRIIDSKSNTIGIKSPFKQDLIAHGTKLINLCLARQDNLIGEPTAVMFRKSDAVRGFRPEYTQIVDLEMWFHLLEKGDFAYIREPLCAFRIHPRQQTINNRSSPLSVLNDVFQLNEEYLCKQYITINKLGKFFIEYDSLYRAWKLYRSNQISKQAAIQEIEARYNYRKFLLLYPFYKTYKPLLKLYRKVGLSGGIA
jgi:glycosyltransferase involved in cell wall biosynthesis